ncbi:MAG: dTDP-4-dehydrorhamnose 3,5-epimerase [Bacteroidales bacterium]|nr:dTDP-4-dehydrorhamnose 3,5-epimerase [Bacteroidales bacterium]MBN2819902.1 dTDP-4-dehydrorhamnose 3,5-epimerase [Bacteroidales bacterium]
MKIIKSPIKDLLIIEPKVFGDSRGYFFEAFNENVLKENGINIRFVQDNQSSSSYGVVRGLHYQKDPKAQTKLVRVLEGTIFDVAVDCRKGSPSFGKWFGLELTAENKKQLFIPKGFAHGFSVLSKNAVVFYKCDEFYAPESDAGILYNDPALNIDWQIPEDKIILSEKDARQPLFSDSPINFKFNRN